MIKNGVPHCDYCKRELVALRDQECLDSMQPHGWTNWKTAKVYSCFECYDNKWIAPCEECRTQPCQKGNGCWANPPLHLFPYETYFANRLGEETYAWKIDEDDFGNPIDLEVRKKQTMCLAGQHPHQKLLSKV